MGGLSKKSARETACFLPERRLFHLTRREADSGRGAPAPSGMPAPVCLPARFCPRWAQEKAHPGRSKETSRCTFAFSLSRSSTAGTTASCETYSWRTKIRTALSSRSNSWTGKQPQMRQPGGVPGRAPSLCHTASGYRKAAELARTGSRRGVNRTRLTALFRMLFEDTVFGILRRERLECARRLLNEKGKTSPK